MSSIFRSRAEVFKMRHEIYCLKNRKIEYPESLKEELIILTTLYLALSVAQTVKHQPAMQETQVRFLGWEDPLEKEVVTYSSTLAWKIPWMEEPGRLQSMGMQWVGHNWMTSLYTIFTIGKNYGLLDFKTTVFYISDFPISQG